MHILSTPLYSKKRLLLSLVLCSLFFSFSLSSFASTYRVTNLNDSGRGSLRDAIQQANLTLTSDVVIFDVAGRIQLQSPIGIGSNIFINGLTAPNATTTAPSVEIVYQYTPFYFNGSTSSTLRGLKITNPSSRPDTDGIGIENSRDITIEYMVISYRLNAINGSVIEDIRIENNDLRDCGFTFKMYQGAAIRLENVTPANLRGGVSIHDNQVGKLRHNPKRVLHLTLAKDIVVSQTNRHANITFFKNQLGVDIPFYFSSINKLEINGIDARVDNYPATQRGVAFEIDNCNTVFITENVVLGREMAVNATTIRDITIAKNDFRDCGAAKTPYTVRIKGLIQNNILGGIEMRDNLFGKDLYYSFGTLQIVEAQNLTVSPSSNSIALNSSGLGSPFPLSFEGVKNLKVEKLDLSYDLDYGVHNGIALSISNSDNVEVIHNQMRRRWTGLQVNKGSDVQVLGNDFIDSGLENGGTLFAALHLDNIQENTVTRGVFVAENQFGLERLKAKRILYFYPATNARITNPNLGGNILLNESGLDLENPLLLVSADHIEVIGLSFKHEQINKGSCAIQVERYAPIRDKEINIYENYFRSWETAIRIKDVSDSYNYIGCNSFVENEIGIETINSTISAQNNNFISNNLAILNRGYLVVNTRNNYWGSSDGSVTDGGSGDAYKGEVTNTTNYTTDPVPCAKEFRTMTTSAPATTSLAKKTAGDLSVLSYPNPVKDKLTIQMTESVDKMAIKVIDALGRIVAQEEVKTATHTIDMINYQKGFYILQIQVGDKVYTQKICKE